MTPINTGHQHRRDRRSRWAATPDDIAITPNGQTAYVTNHDRQLGDPDHHRHQHRRDADHRSGASPYGIAITPDGKTAYVANYADATR